MSFNNCAENINYFEQEGTWVNDSNIYNCNLVISCFPVKQGQGKFGAKPVLQKIRLEDGENFGKMHVEKPNISIKGK